MSVDTERDRDEVGLDQYWKRRAVALGGALALVGVLAWSCAGGDEPKKDQVRNAAGAESGSPSPSVPTAMPTVTVTATAKVTKTARPPRKDGDACDPSDVVVTFTAAGERFAAGATPRFQLTAVNLAERPCTLDVGSGAMDLRITSGSDRVYSAAECDGGRSGIQMLRRGVPYVTTLTWDRKRSTDGCQGRRAAADAGTYVAELKTKAFKLRRQVFALR